MNRCGTWLICLAVLAGCAGETLAPSPESAPLPDAALVRHPFLSYTMSVLPLDAAYAINGSGAIVGRLGTNAAVYSRGVVTVLPGKAGYTNLTAVDIADNGFIVGSGLSAGYQRGLFWRSATAEPLDIGALGLLTTPKSINSAGTVVGAFQLTAGSLNQAFRWSLATGMVPIAPATTNQSDAVDISESGYIGGVAWYPQIGQQVVRWYPSGAVGRITGPGLAFRATNDGSIVGQGGGGATLWNLSNTAQPIGPAPTTHLVKQISSAGRNIGFALLPSIGWRAWTTIGNSASPFYLPAPAGANAFAYDVNGCGAILGSVSLADGTQKAVVWTRIFCDALPVLQP